MRPYLRSSGRVLWLTETPQSLQTYLGELKITARKRTSWEGNWATTFSWIRQGVMFGSIPTQGVIDFAFADLTPENMLQGFKPRDFASDVHAGLFVGWLHKPVVLIGSN